MLQGSDSDPERTEKKWRIKTQKSARTYRACAMYQMEKHIAEKLVVTREAKM